MELIENFQPNRVLFQHSLVGVIEIFPPPQESVTSLCHNVRYFLLYRKRCAYCMIPFFKPIF